MGVKGHMKRNKTRRLHRSSLCLPMRRKWAQSGYFLPLRRLRLTQRQMQEFIGLLNWGGGLLLQIWDLNRALENRKKLFFQYHRFSACVDADYDIKESIKIFNKQCNEYSMNTFYYKQGLLAIGDCFLLVYYYPKC